MDSLRETRYIVVSCRRIDVDDLTFGEVESRDLPFFACKSRCCKELAITLEGTWGVFVSYLNHLVRAGVP